MAAPSEAHERVNCDSNHQITTGTTESARRQCRMSRTNPPDREYDEHLSQGVGDDINDQADADRTRCGLADRLLMKQLCPHAPNGMIDLD
jgi:hypothetical protein